MGSEPLREKDEKEPGSPQITPPADPKAPETPPANPDPSQPPAVPEGYVKKEEYDEIVKKYGASSQEALMWRERYNERFGREQDINNTPTEQEMREIYGPAWDEMTDEGRLIATRNEAGMKLARKLASDRQADDEAKALDRNIDIAIEADPELEGREEAFREYCKRPTHRGVAIKILTSAFKHEVPATPPTAPAPAGFENPGGGPRNPANPRAKFTASQALALQRSDPRKYTELLMRGELEEFIPE